LGFELFKSLYAKVTTKGVVFISILVAIVLLITHDNYIFNWIDLDETFLVTIPSGLKKLIITLAVINLIGIAIILSRRLFTTIEVIEAKCLDCKANMNTKILKCTNCGKEFG
jgi:hypothetical protein